jgi:hypothetical protein
MAKVELRGRPEIGESIKWRGASLRAQRSNPGAFSPCTSGLDCFAALAMTEGASHSKDEARRSRPLCGARWRLACRTDGGAKLSTDHSLGSVSALHRFASRRRAYGNSPCRLEQTKNTIPCSRCMRAPGWAAARPGVREPAGAACGSRGPGQLPLMTGGIRRYLGMSLAMKRDLKRVFTEPAGHVATQHEPRVCRPIEGTAIPAPAAFYLYLQRRRTAASIVV